ncbi:Phosphatidylserine decarboxylase proenzyme 2 [Rhynchospora pubera]|uniref:Phosphatidylserine decarboxylase proenzyme 2 n=1 Tax=Rhynchospora pubera TaxID=906938 RepID=A0AAV8C1X7_9POAL|nr:Phosphatidylserine decarboxylase proenzyme 2 [Rhynchospora pubera]
MGHASSKRGSVGGDAPAPAPPPPPSRFTRFKRRLRHPIHRSGSASGSGSEFGNIKNLSEQEFTGIARIEIIGAEMKFKDRWFACLSLGERTYRTETSDHTEKPVWKSEKKVVLEANGPTVARISVFETNKFSKSNLIGYCELNLTEILSQESEDNMDEFQLFDPCSSTTTVGTISIRCFIEDSIEIQRSFAQRVLSVVDKNGDGQLSLSEFSELMNAFCSQLSKEKIEELFKQADKNDDDIVDMDELAVLLAQQQQEETIINNCPVCGENLGKYDNMNDIIHMTLCFDEGTGNQIMTGGFLTEKQASYGWMFKLSEWAHYSSYDVGLHSGSSASHILVFDRKTKRLVEETIDGKIILSMRAIYQSKVGLALIDAGVKGLLQNLSEKQGKQMNSPESAKDIPKFLEFFKDQINMDEVKYPIEHFKTFNDFFVRELKSGARPICYPDRDEVAVCAADSRLMAFNSASDSTRLWVKGRKFSIEGLLGPETCTDSLRNGTLVIFRLAPQDYHRFHVPVSGTIESFVDIPGYLYTVNPIAVNSKYCNVFTENKRAVSIISTQDFGKVAFVAIGATMVGSITFLKEKGEYVNKGDEFGYFAFGGSTVICVFEKDAIQIDDDLLANSERSLETLVSVGTTLGVSKKVSDPEREVLDLDKCSLTE